MKFKILLFIFASICISIFIWDVQSQPNKQSPARSIFSVSVNPLACKESEVFYNMTTHQFLVCTSVNTLSTVSFGGGGGGGGVGITFLNGLTGSTQAFAIGTSGTNFAITSSGSTHTFNIPNASGVARGLLTSADWTLFNNKQPALGFTPENPANKNALNGYAGLSSGKLTASQATELLGITDLTDYTSASGTGTTAIKATFTSLTTNDCLLWNGTDWVNSNTCASGATGITSLNALSAASQTFAIGTSGSDFNISSSSSTHTFNFPSASALNRGLLLAADWTTFNNKQAALGFTPENSSNKNATNGYAGLSSGKITTSQITELLGIADLTDFTGKSGNGTTAIGATITSVQTNDCLIWDGGKWVNSASCGSGGSGDMLLAGIQTITGAKTFNATTLIIGSSASTPAVVANSLYRNTSDGKLYIGSNSGASWNEILEAGVSGPISVSNGGNGLVGIGANVASASTISISGKIFHVTGTTNITSVSASGISAGTEITIVFDGILTFTDGSNLKLNGNFVTSADDTITLVYDGTNFYEVARSTN